MDAAPARGRALTVDRLDELVELATGPRSDDLSAESWRALVILADLARRLDAVEAELRCGSETQRHR